MTTTTDRVERIETVTIKEATKDPRDDGSFRWKLRIEATKISRYPLPVTMPAEWANSDLLAGEVHTVRLVRGNLKDGKKGEYASDYWWNLAAWDVTAASRPAPVVTTGGEFPASYDASNTPATTPSGVPSDWAGSFEEERWARVNRRERWRDAVMVAAERVQGTMYPTLAEWAADISSHANAIYPIILKGPSSPAAAPTQPAYYGDTQAAKVPETGADRPVGEWETASDMSEEGKPFWPGPFADIKEFVAAVEKAIGRQVASWSAWAKANWPAKKTLSDTIPWQEAGTYWRALNDAKEGKL